MVPAPNLLALGTTWLERINGGDHLGSWWAYCELGWGGWWFWYLVENASLLPWLSATALLHSLSLDTPAADFPPLVAVAGDSSSDAVAAGHLNCPFWHSGFGSCVRAG
ncbi:cytochrome c biogenesis protein CcsA [Escherichia coli]